MPTVLAAPGRAERYACCAVPAVQVPDAYEEPGERVFTPGENLLEWLTDKRGRDQFVLRCAALPLPCMPVLLLPCMSVHVAGEAWARSVYLHMRHFGC